MHETVHTRSFQTSGEACPSPGISLFQRMFFSALHSVGTPVSRHVPSPRGPRQHGQYSACSIDELKSEAATIDARQNDRIMRALGRKEEAVAGEAAYCSIPPNEPRPCSLT